jgi:protein CpxP
MKRKYLWLPAMLGALAIIGAPVMAQSPAAGKHHAKEGMKHLNKTLKELNLTSDQKTKVKAIMKDSAEKRKGIMADAKLTVEQKKANIKDLHKETRGQILAVLTPEQREKLKSMHKDRGKHKGEAPQSEPNAKPLPEAGK